MKKNWIIAGTLVSLLLVATLGTVIAADDSELGTADASAYETVEGAITAEVTDGELLPIITPIPGKFKIISCTFYQKYRIFWLMVVTDIKPDTPTSIFTTMIVWYAVLTNVVIVFIWTSA